MQFSCSLFSFLIRSFGHSLFGFLRLCLSFLCLQRFTMRFSCVFLSSFRPFPVPFAFHSSSLDTSWSSCIIFASLQSWASLLHVLFSVSGLLVGPHSLSVLLSTASICICLLPFLPVFVSSASPCRCFGDGLTLRFFSMVPSFCYCRFLGCLSLRLMCLSCSILFPCFRVGFFCLCGLEHLFIAHHPVSWVSSLLSFVWQY